MDVVEDTMIEDTVIEDAMTDPWSDCSDQKLVEILTLVESQGTQPNQMTDEMNSESDMQSSNSTNSENDRYMYELWSEILNDNQSLGDVRNNRMRCKLNLGKNMFVTAGLWKGEMKVHVRRFDPSKGFATTKGVVFSLDLWKKFGEMFDEIDQHFDKIQKLNGSDTILEVGERIFVEMNIGSPQIDLRLWWLPRASKCLVRTTKGIRLNPWQWDKLKATFRYLPTFVPELNE
jgi:hypothetical protein